jgi:dynein heavy chain, axonemal
MSSDKNMCKLWVHECQRVFHDRLISQVDRDNFTEMLGTVMQDKFKMSMDALIEQKPLMFCSFVPCIYPDEEAKKPYNNVYCEVSNNMDLLKKKTEAALENFNLVNRAKRMDLVLFADAIGHVINIHRVITT